MHDEQNNTNGMIPYNLCYTNKMFNYFFLINNT